MIKTSPLIFFLCFTFMALVTSIQAQGIHLSANEINFKSSQDQIQLKQLSSDEFSSAYAISIRDSVRAHFHKQHTETILVLEGEAIMRLGEEQFTVRAGDFINVPKGTIHAVWVNSDIPLKVISVQAPQFFGKDRHYLHED